MKLLNFDYWAHDDDLYLIPTMYIYTGFYYHSTDSGRNNTVGLVIAFLRLRVKWLWLTRRECNG